MASKRPSLKLWPYVSFQNRIFKMNIISIYTTTFEWLIISVHPGTHYHMIHNAHTILNKKQALQLLTYRKYCLWGTVKGEINSTIKNHKVCNACYLFTRLHSAVVTVIMTDKTQSGSEVGAVWVLFPKVSISAWPNISHVMKAKYINTSWKSLWIKHIDEYISSQNTCEVR